MFTGTNAIEFAKIFPDNDACYTLLEAIKWKNGYHCFKCGCADYVKGRTRFHRRCRKCGYDESLTANTLFHDMRMPVKKAFFMLFHISTRLKGMSTAELARLVGVQQRTGWLFKRKAQVAMERDENQLSFLELLLNSFNQLIEKGRRRNKRPGRKENNRSCLNKRKARSGEGKGNIVKRVPRMLIPFINFLGGNHHDWTFPGTGIQQLLFHSWIAGIHHKCSEALHRCYCDEFAYRFERRENKDNIFETLVADMLHAKPHPYSVLRLACG